MMGFVRAIVVCVLGLVGFGSFAGAQQGSYGSIGTDPQSILQRTVSETNEDTDLQSNRLNNVSRLEGGYANRFTISNTLDSLRVRIAPYLQWLVYIGLTLAAIFIIYNGFLMVTGSFHSMGDWSSVQSRLITLITGVLIITGFYFIIQLLVVLVNTLSQ